jgi:hypothetical protein
MLQNFTAAATSKTMLGEGVLAIILSRASLAANGVLEDIATKINCVFYAHKLYFMQQPPFSG